MNTCPSLLIISGAFIFGENKTKCIIFDTKVVFLNKTSSLDFRYGTIQTKQYHTATYLGCAWDQTLSGETMTLKVKQN